MDLFETLKNEKFFKPLGSKNKRIYYECIVKLIERSKQIPVLYESEARDCITIYLNNCIYEYEDENENIVTELPATTIISYLRECGWLSERELGRNGENMTSVTVMCRRIIDFLVKISAKSNTGELSNHIINMYEIMKSTEDENSPRLERPYTNMFIPMVENMEGLENELMDLKENIAIIMKAVIEFNDVNSIGNYINKNEMLQKFFSDYFYIKNNGIISSYTEFIKSRIRTVFSKDSRTYIKLIDEFVEKSDIEMEDAADIVEEKLSRINTFIEYEYEENIEAIDRRINDYYNLANTRIMLSMSNGTNLDSIIDQVLNELKKEDISDRLVDKLNESLQICTQKYIGTKSFEKKKRNKKNPAQQIIIKEKLSIEEKERRTNELKEKSYNKYSLENVNQFLDNLDFSKNSLEIKNAKITSREETLMYAAAIMYSGHKDFQYKIEMGEGIVHTDVADITNLVIKKENQK